MRFRAPVYVVALAAVSTFALTQPDHSEAQGPRSFGNISSSPSGSFQRSSSIEGTVQSIDGKLLKDVRVDLHDVSSGTVLTTAYTSSGGGFEFASVPDGVYEVVAISGTNQVSERINVAAFKANVSLRLPVTDVPSDTAGRDSISVAQYK